MRTRLFLPVLAVLLAAAPAAAKPATKSLKPGKVHPLTTTKHDRRWSLYVPSKYSKKASWPVVITSHGRGGEGAKEIRSWQALANKYGFLVAAPDMVTATNHRPAKSKLAPSREDDEVLLEIFAFVCDNFRVNRRAVMVTGFSGGGNPSYHSGLRHPEVFTHICTRGGNFAPQQIPDAEAISAGNKRLQIYIYFGEHDHVLIIGDQGNNGQAHAARDALKRADYENVEFEQIKGMKHASRPDIAAAWFGAYIAANKKTFKAGDKADAILAKATAAFEKKKYKDAVKYALQCTAAEEKSGLQNGSKALLVQLNHIGATLLKEAEALRAADPKLASRKATAVARDFKGLAVGSAAKALVASLKE